MCGDSCKVYHLATHISCHLHGRGVSGWISTDLRRRWINPMTANGTRHGTTTDIITPQAPCSTGEWSQCWPCRHATTAPTPLPALQNPAMHSHEWKHTPYSCQMTPRSACSRWTVSRRRSPTPWAAWAEDGAVFCSLEAGCLTQRRRGRTWTHGASPFSARTTSLRRTFVISLQGVRFCRINLITSTTRRTTFMAYARVQTTRWTD